MPKNDLLQRSAKNDKRKTAKAVRPLRFIDNLFLFCRNSTSTCWVQSPHVLMKIFLTGYPSILYIEYINRSQYLQAIKIPPNFKKRSRRVIRTWRNNPPEHRFFIRWACPTCSYIKNRADDLWDRGLSAKQYHQHLIFKLKKPKILKLPEPCHSGSLLFTLYLSFQNIPELP